MTSMARTAQSAAQRGPRLQTAGGHIPTFDCVGANPLEIDACVTPCSTWSAGMDLLDLPYCASKEGGRHCE